MSFAQKVKQEILNQEFSLPQAHAFISGLITASGQRDGSSYIVRFNKKVIANSVKDMIKQMDLKYSIDNKNKNWIIFHNFSLLKEIKMPGIFFAGIFLGGGSIADPESPSYHLEIQFYSHQAARQVQLFLNKYAFKFSLIQRRTNHVLYLKKADQIADFLKAIQAFQSLMYFEDMRINRDFHNQLNRYSNLDAYNQQKLVKANLQFKKKYQFIKENNLTSDFREVELAFFEIKLKNPYSSLAELSKLYFQKTKIKKTRAGLNHYLIKLRKIYENFNQKK